MMWQLVIILLGFVGALPPRQYYPASTTGLHRFQTPSFKSLSSRPFYQPYSKFFPAYRSLPPNSLNLRQLSFENPKLSNVHRSPLTSLGYFPFKFRTNAEASKVLAYSATPVVAVAQQPLLSASSFHPRVQKPVVTFKSGRPAPRPKKISFTPHDQSPRFAYNSPRTSFTFDQIVGFGDSPEVLDSASVEYYDNLSLEDNDYFSEEDEGSSEEGYYRNARSISPSNSYNKDSYQAYQTGRISAENYDDLEKMHYAQLAFGSKNAQAPTETKPIVDKFLRNPSINRGSLLKSAAPFDNVRQNQMGLNFIFEDSFGPPNSVETVEVYSDIRSFVPHLDNLQLKNDAAVATGFKSADVPQLSDPLNFKNAPVPLEKPFVRESASPTKYTIVYERDSFEDLNANPGFETDFTNTKFSPQFSADPSFKNAPFPFQNPLVKDNTPSNKFTFAYDRDSIDAPFSTVDVSPEFIPHVRDTEFSPELPVVEQFRSAATPLEKPLVKDNLSPTKYTIVYDADSIEDPTYDNYGDPGFAPRLTNTHFSPEVPVVESFRREALPLVKENPSPNKYTIVYDADSIEDFNYNSYAEPGFVPRLTNTEFLPELSITGGIKKEAEPLGTSLIKENATPVNRDSMYETIYT